MVALPFGITLAVEAGSDVILASSFCRCKAKRSPGNHPLLREAERQLNAYARRRLRRFDLPLHLCGTAFQRAVWRLVAQLETGEAISYGDVAKAIGAPGAHRAVAAAMRATPFDLLVPAHRVIGSDGTVRGAGPRSLRRRLLAFEDIRVR